MLLHDVKPNSPPDARISFRWDPDTQVTVATWYGVMTDPILLRNYRQHYGTEGYDPTSKELTDLRYLTENQITTDGLKKMAALAKRFERCGPTAIVANNDLSFGLGRMYNVFGPDGTNRIEVFRELNEALEWLGITGEGAKSLAAE